MTPVAPAATAPPSAVVPRCHLPWQEMIIQADGTVEPCCYWTAHGNANPPLGNINESPIEEIWNNARYQALRAAMARGDLKAAGCAGCFAIRQGQTLGLEYDPACETPDFADTPYARNIAVLKQEVARGATRLEAKPTIVSVTASHKCNLACTHCYQNSSRERQWARAEAFAEVEALVPSLVRLIAGGGEPLLLSGWRRFVAEFDRRQAPLLNYAMTTNATVVRPEILRGLEKFRSLHVIVSMDGANAEVYERIRVNGSFAEVERNIARLQAAVRGRPRTAVTTFGLCMSVMKSNIAHLPDFVRWAAARGLPFSIHPVLKMPLRESLVSFNDPAREMAGWREALDEARRLVREIEAPELPEVWRATQRLRGRAARDAWPFFGAIEDFIPWDIGFTRHWRVRLALPPDVLAEADRRWPRGGYLAAIEVTHALDWKTNTSPYHADVVDGAIEVSLPAGEVFVSLMNAFDLTDAIHCGTAEIRPSGAAWIAPWRSSGFARDLARLMGRAAAGQPPGAGMAAAASA